MKTKKFAIFFILLIVLAACGFYMVNKMHRAPEESSVKLIAPFKGSIETFISSTAMILPKNRLQIKPPVAGRIDSILVAEGDNVKVGEILAWMSSTERAALLDAARGKGEDQLKHWEQIYKQIPLYAPIAGEVIVATIQPGETVTALDAVVVLSDHLIARAQVDETDIGKIILNMKAIITLDAYPDIKINASVEHVYYESKTVNNVTIYEVDLKPEQLPEFLRSGMNANVDFIDESKENILLVPQEAVHSDKDGDYCLIKQDDAKEPVRARVKLGVSDDKNVEVLSGISLNDRIVVLEKKYSLPKNSIGSNPFMPGRKK